MKKDLSNYSDEELMKEFKSRRLFLGVFIGLIVAMAVTSIVTFLNNKVSATNYIFIAFLPLLMMFWNSYNAAKKEVKSRKLN